MLISDILNLRGQYSQVSGGLFDSLYDMDIDELFTEVIKAQDEFFNSKNKH